MFSKISKDYIIYNTYGIVVQVYIRKKKIIKYDELNLGDIWFKLFAFLNYCISRLWRLLPSCAPVVGLRVLSMAAGVPMGPTIKRENEAQYRYNWSKHITWQIVLVFIKWRKKSSNNLLLELYAHIILSFEFQKRHF